MRTKSVLSGRASFLSAVSAFVVAALLPLSAAAQVAGTPNFVGPPAFGADAPQPPERGVTRARNVSIAFAALDQAIGALKDKPSTPYELALPLFDGATTQVRIDRADITADGTQTFTGRIAGDPLSSATIVSREGIVSANFQTGDGRAYQIRFRGAGVHELREMDMRQFREPDIDYLEPPKGSGAP